MTIAPLIALVSTVVYLIAWLVSCSLAEANAFPYLIVVVACAIVQRLETPHHHQAHQTP